MLLCFCVPDSVQIICDVYCGAKVSTYGSKTLGTQNWFKPTTKKAASLRCRIVLLWGDCGVAGRAS